MDKKPLVSVIIPCYNAEKFLSTTLQSVLKQTYDNIEIIIVDDGSTDSTSQIVSNLIEQNPTDKKIIFYRQANKGVSAARNLGIQMASGEIIAFLDSDDIWYPHKVITQLELLDAHSDVVIVASNFDRLSPYGKLLKTKKISKKIYYLDFQQLAVKNKIGTSTVMVRKEIFEKVGFFDESLRGPEDWDMWLRIAKVGKIAYIDEPLAIYREHYESLSKKNPKHQEEHVWKVIEKNVLSDSSLSEKIKKECLFNFYLDMGVLYYVRNYFSESRNRLRKALKIKKFNPLCLFTYIKALIGSVVGAKIMNLIRSRKILFKKRVFNSQYDNEVYKDKIMFILPNRAGGGAERVTFSVIENLSDKFQIILVLLKNEGVYQIPQNVSKIYCLNKKSRWSFFKLILKLAYIINKERPKIMFSVLDASHIITFFARKISFVKPKWFINDHSIQSLAISGQNFTAIKKFIIKKSYQECDKVVAVSKAVKDDLVCNFSVQPDKVLVIYNGINIEMIKKLATEEVEHLWFKEKVPIIISVGRLEKEKGYEYLLQAFALIRKEMECRLVIIGEGREKERLVSLVEELEIQSSVVFLPFQKNPWKYVAKSTVFVLSSLREGLPLVLIEAMACGVPVVATDVGGVKEVVKNQETGIIVPPQNVLALAEAIKTLLLSEETRKRFIINSYSYVLKNFNLNLMIKQYENLIQYSHFNII